MISAPFFFRCLCMYERQHMIRKSKRALVCLCVCNKGIISWLWPATPVEMYRLSVTEVPCDLYVISCCMCSSAHAEVQNLMMHQPPPVLLCAALSECWTMHIQQRGECFSRKMRSALTTLLWAIMIDCSSQRRFLQRTHTRAKWAPSFGQIIISNIPATLCNGVHARSN